MEEKITGNSVRAVIGLWIYGCPYFIPARQMAGRGGKERNGIIAWREKEDGAGDKKRG